MQTFQPFRLEPGNSCQHKKLTLDFVCCTAYQPTRIKPWPAFVESSRSLHFSHRSLNIISKFDFTSQDLIGLPEFDT